MKKRLGLLSFFLITSLQAAGLPEVTFKNLNYQNQLTLKCMDADCENIKLITNSFRDQYYYTTVKMQDLDDLIYNRIKLVSQFDEIGYMSKEGIKSIRKNYREGYTGNAVSEAFALPFMSFGDTIQAGPLLIARSIEKFAFNHRHSRKVAATIKNKLLSGEFVVELKDRYFQEIYSLLSAFNKVVDIPLTKLTDHMAFDTIYTSERKATRTFELKNGPELKLLYKDAEVSIDELGDFTEPEFKVPSSIQPNNDDQCVTLLREMYSETFCK